MIVGAGGGVVGECCSEGVFRVSREGDLASRRAVGKGTTGVIWRSNEVKSKGVILCCYVCRRM